MYVCAVGLCMSCYTCGSQDKSAVPLEGYMSVLWHACGGQRTVQGSEFSPWPWDQTQMVRLYLLALQFLSHQPDRREGEEEEEEGERFMY